MRAHLRFAALLITAGAARLFLNNVSLYSRADETVYLRYIQLLAAGGGYARLVRMFVADPSMWVFPSPLRWSYIGTAALFCRTYQDLATLSTIAGIVAVGLTYWIGLQLFDRRVALIAATLMATSPLQLALGRRALADEFFCAMFLGSMVAMLTYIRRPERPPLHMVAWVVLATLTFAAKEQFALIYPVVLLFWWLRERKIRWQWILPPILYAGVFCILARDAGAFLRVAKITTSTIGAPYAAQYQGGPPHRLLIDLMIVAPLVTIGFFLAAAAPFRSAAAEPPLSTRQLFVLAGGILVLHSLLVSKNLRYLVSADPLMRLMVAAWLPPGRWTAAALIVNAAVEIALFYVIFIRGGVYDPVTRELLRALGMG